MTESLHPTPAPTPAPATTAAKQPSAASRYLFVFLLGLLVGAIGLVMLTRWMESKRTPQDNWPDAVMTLMAVHNGSLSQKVEQNRCNATDILPHLRNLREMTNDLEPAFSSLSEVPTFANHAANMRAIMDAALASPPINCAAAKEVQSTISAGCKACHQDFR